MIDKRQFISKYCDVQTKDGVWRLGVVEGVKGNKEDKDIVEVALDGWSKNKNQKICLHSNRIQPPRFFSRAYTGQKSLPLRNMKFDMTQISYIVNWLKLFHNFDFQNLPIFEITNIFRCQMFILVDNIIHHQWSNDKESIEENLKKIEILFHNIVQISVMFLEKIPKFFTEISHIPYQRYSYLQSHSVSYIEASYEIFQTLKTIFGFTPKSEKFFAEYKDYFTISYVDEFIDLGSINLLNRLWKEFKHNKLFEDKFYLIANILQLNMTIFNKSNHHKLGKSNQVKYLTEILNFLYRENYVDCIKKLSEDFDIKSLVDSFVQFAKNNKNFVTDSQRFGNFLKSVKETAYINITEGSPGRRMPLNQPRRIASHNNITLKSGENLSKVNNKLFSSFGNLVNGKTNKLNQLENINPPITANNTNINNNNPDYSDKLFDIDKKLLKLDDKLSINFYKTPETTTNNLKKNINNTNLNNKYATTEFNIISPVKPKLELQKLQLFDLEQSLIVNPIDSFISCSDPFDEYNLLKLIELNLDNENLDAVRKIIKWRRRILEISKNNGWVVGKVLAAKTIKKLEITDSDIIEANLKFLEKYNLIDINAKDEFDLEIDYKGLLREYEKELVSSLLNS